MIRPARFADVEAMHRIRLAVRENRLADPSSIGPEDYRCRLDTPGISMVAESDGGVVGFAVGDAESASIWALFVDPASEGRGIGRLLHDALVAALFARGLNELRLSTDPGTRAERFYRRAGWQPGGETKGSEVGYRLTPADWIR